MATETKSRLWWVVVHVLISLIVVGGLTGCGKDADEADDANTAAVTPASGTGQASVDPLETAASLFREPTVNVQNIVKAAKTWQPTFKDWWGKLAPDFTLNDIEGNVHTLSEYRGKNVVVVIWASWVATCEKIDVPHLKELCDAYQDKDLAVLAISNESPALLKQFAEEHNVNFTILSRGASLPAPFADAKYVPSRFFIDPRGRFKVIAGGPVPSSDAKAIIQAQ